MKDTAYTPTEAETKLVEFCKKESNLDVFVHQVGRTEWIYLTMNEPIFAVQATPPNEHPGRKPAPFSLLSLEGDYDNRAFAFTYDIVPDVLPPEPITYGQSYNENYTKKRQLIYQGLQESFFNLAKDEDTKAAAPIFFVIVVADINTGVGTKNTIYLEDLKVSMTGAIPSDEYYLRELSEIFGDKKLINDKTGNNLARGEEIWPDFLADQIKQRIRFRFTQSDFPPQADPDREIIAIVANTLHLYPFRDFDRIDLYNLRQKREMDFSSEQLKTFEEQPVWSKDKGKLTVIKFRVPQTPPGGNTDQNSLDDATKTK
jgi:hypothetical protein